MAAVTSLPTAAATMRNSRRCPEHFPAPADMLGADFQAVLQVLAAAYAVDISAIEARHASTREFTLLRSRGWVPNLEAIGSKFSTQS